MSVILPNLARTNEKVTYKRLEFESLSALCEIALFRSCYFSLPGPLSSIL